MGRRREAYRLSRNTGRVPREERRGSTAFPKYRPGKSEEEILRKIALSPPILYQGSGAVNGVSTRKSQITASKNPRALALPPTYRCPNDYKKERTAPSGGPSR
jgi:hypothetical protein